MVISKRGERAPEGEYLDPTGQASKGLRWHSRRQNWTTRSSATLTPQRKDELKRVALRFVFEPARCRLDSRKSNGAGSFLSCRPGGGGGGSTVAQSHHQDPSTALC